MQLTAGQIMFWHRLAFAVLSDRDEAIAEFVAGLRTRRTLPSKV